MFDQKILEDLPRKLHAVLPDGFKTLESDIQKRFKDILLAFFASLDLVTREEFDVQTKVLACTREKVEELEILVDELLNK